MNKNRLCIVHNTDSQREVPGKRLGGKRNERPRDLPSSSGSFSGLSGASGMA